jgi:uncharacterized protein DUF1918
MRAARPGVTSGEAPPRHGAGLRAEAGDTLVIEVPGTAAARIGRILDVLGVAGAPPYRVRWLAGEYESVVTPGRDARVEKGHPPAASHPG